VSHSAAGPLAQFAWEHSRALWQAWPLRLGTSRAPMDRELSQFAAGCPSYGPLAYPEPAGLGMRCGRGPPAVRAIEREAPRFTNVRSHPAPGTISLALAVATRCGRGPSPLRPTNPEPSRFAAVRSRSKRGIFPRPRAIAKRYGRRPSGVRDCRAGFHRSRYCYARPPQ